MARKRKAGDQERKTPQPQAPKSKQKNEPIDYSELILVAHAGNLSEAELLKTELKAHGIPAILEGEGASIAGLPDIGAGIPILVPEEFADQAAELIAELEAAKPEGNALAKDEEIFDEDDEDDLDTDLEDKKDDEEEDPEDEDLEEEDEEDEDWDEDEDEDEDEEINELEDDEDLDEEEEEEEDEEDSDDDNDY